MHRMARGTIPADEVSDVPLRVLAAEVTREKLFLRLHQELPYQSTVETEVWKKLKDGSVRVEQTIYVERESQRKIVLGPCGPDDQSDRLRGAPRDRGDRRIPGASVPVREDSRELGRRSRPLPRDGAGISEGLGMLFLRPTRRRATGAIAITGLLATVSNPNAQSHDVPRLETNQKTPRPGSRYEERGMVS